MKLAATLRARVFIFLFFLLTLSMTTAIAHELRPEVVTGLIYDLEDKSETPPVLFRQRVEFENFAFENKDHKRIIRNTYTTDADGVILQSVARCEAGVLVSYQFQQKQVGESFQITIEGGEVNYNYRMGEETAQGSTSLPKNLAVAPTLVDQIRLRWKELFEEGSIRVRLAVPERQEDIGFKLFVDTSGDIPAGVDSVVIKMRPSSILIQPLVKPIYFVMSKDGTRLLEYRGPSPLFKKDESGWVQMQVRAVFSSSLTLDSL